MLSAQEQAKHLPPLSPDALGSCTKPQWRPKAMWGLPVATGKSSSHYQQGGNLAWRHWPPHCPLPSQQVRSQARRHSSSDGLPQLLWWQECKSWVQEYMMPPIELARRHRSSSHPPSWQWRRQEGMRKFFPLKWQPRNSCLLPHKTGNPGVKWGGMAVLTSYMGNAGTRTVAVVVGGIQLWISWIPTCLFKRARIYSPKRDENSFGSPSLNSGDTISISWGIAPTED